MSGTKIRCPSPEHNDSDPSFAIYPNGGYCFGCGYRLSPEQLEAEGLYHLAQENGNGSNGEYKPSLSSVRWWHQALISGPCRDRRDFFHSRGLSTSTIESFLFGHTGDEFSLPLWYDRELVGVQFRRDEQANDSGKRYRTPRGQSIVTVRPKPHLSRGVVVVCEGVIDAAILVQYGYDVVTTNGGAGALPRIVRSEFWNDRRTKLYVATDMDKAGDEAYRKIQRRFPRAMRVRWPHGNDINEALVLVEPYERGMTLQRWLQEASIEECQTLTTGGGASVTPLTA